MSYVGINIGALTVKVVHLDNEQVSFRAVSHQGRPVQALQEILQEFGTRGYYGVCGCLGHISEWRRLPFRVSEAILKPYSLERGIPILTYESDGFSAHPAFLRQVDVHIQQVLPAPRLRRPVLYEVARRYDPANYSARRWENCSRGYLRALGSEEVAPDGGDSTGV
jgi:hypothetical protein